ncbi:family 43 glycosylhydrolase [Motilibacter aurantiacus]|uniref:family 43 glycosylhydrolase n=1 Tax=Motilibacter aurantiacus TaxID=2714955 RepID=UPI00140A916F|nr:family 43 glycosylhydrolase [Motilibacter aurantiacus]NHC44917.1 family 43 glycosylhydrolase [Motilibacter aurantiacus]
MARPLVGLLSLALALGTAGAVTAPAAQAAEVAPGLVLHYPLQGDTGTVAEDASGNGRDGVLNGTALEAPGQGLAFNGTNTYVRMPDNILAGLDSITVTADVYVNPAQATPYFIYGMGNTSGSTGNGYLFTTGNDYRSAIATGNWSTEQNIRPAASYNLSRGVWKSIAVTIGGGVGVVYENGVEVGRNNAVTIRPSQIGNGVTTANYVGRSVYTGDRLFNGRIRDFRIYDRALAADEVNELAATVISGVVAVDKAALTLGDTSAVTGSLTLPTTGAGGSTISWASSNPSLVSPAGVVTRPAYGSPPGTATLTATLSYRGISDTRTFEVTVLAQSSDAELAAQAAAALAVPNADDVRGNVTLPTTSRGATVSWASSDPAVVTATGEVARQAADTQVTLTATVTYGAQTTTRTLPLRVRAKAALAPYAGYAFAYFTGDSITGEKIYMAASRGNNALAWDELNGGQPVLTSTQGTKGLRDPFVIRSPEGDKFYLIATDLSIGSGTSWDASQRQGSRYIEVWESTDLKTWSDQRHVLVSPETAGNTWAPEAYYDESLGSYVVFWASKLYAANDPGHTGNTYNRMLYATTRDFVTFSEPKIWQDRGESRIDSTVIRESGTYYRFTKDEGGGGTGCSDIIQEKSTSLTAVDLPGQPAWAMQDSCIGRDAGTAAVEGPTVFKANPGDVNGQKYYLFVDEYGRRGYIPLASTSLETPNWAVPASYKLPGAPRHGTVVPVTKAELDGLRAGLPTVEPVPANAKGEILRYSFDQASGSTVTDSSGNAKNGTIVGGGTWTGVGSLRLDGVDDYVDIPDNLLAGVTDITIEADVKIDPTQATPYFVYGFGNTDSAGAGSGYLFTTGDSYRAAIASGNWTTEQGVTGTGAVARGVWKHLTYVLSGTTATLYLDGVQVGRSTDVTLDPGDIGNGYTLANYLGKSVYNGDRTLKGEVREFAVYNRALSAQEVMTASGNTAAVVDVTLPELKAPAIVDADGGGVTLPVKPGTDVTTLAPTLVTSAGATVSPENGSVRDLTSPVTYTVTGTDGKVRAWTVRAVQMRTPVLPGLYADPNIAVFGDTFYIYATTDGTPGWGGKDFYVWKSKNLVDWERSEKPFLTLDGVNGNVPWATGNAWAPTIIERGGKYYFYFSGHNPAVNRKTIGVAVADSPEGPFTAQPTAMILNNEAVTSGQAIDPAAFRDPATGKYYLFWGNGSPVYGELSDDMLSVKPGTFKRINGLTDFREGAFVNYRNGTYHLTYAIDDTGSPNYRVGYATSTSIDGPWTYRGVLLEKDPSQGLLGTGHSSIVQVPGTDEWYIAYHRFAIPGGDGTHRETTIDRLHFGADGLMQRVAPTLTGVDPVVVDLTGPEITAATAGTADGTDGWFRTPASVIVTATDPRGVASIEYSVDGGTTWKAYTAPFSVADGTTTVKARATDGRGNVGTAADLTVRQDTLSPVVTLTGGVTGGGAYGHSARPTVAWSAADATSGVASTSATLDGKTLSNGAAVDLSALPLGGHTLVVRATDRAGHVQELTVTFTVTTSTTDLAALADRYLASGALSQGAHTNLRNRLEGAVEALAEGNRAKAARYLQQYVEHAERRVDDPAVRSLLITDARALLAQLGG